MKKILSIAIVLMMIISCKKNFPEERIVNNLSEKENNSGGSEASGHIKIAVIADIHFMHPSLLHNNAQNGEPFQAALVHRPLIEYSQPIFSQVLLQLEKQHPDIVLIAGNLALDGEKISHQAVADSLKRLSMAGIKVYVVPGRYDINNPKSFEYYVDHSNKVPNVTPPEFKSIYKDYGYDNTSNVISKDPASLSYIVQPFPGLWILSIDALKYKSQNIGGVIATSTLEWIREQLGAAKEQNITVFGLMSHSLIEHVKDQNKFRPNTVIDNWQAAADVLMQAGVKVIFTGTVHAIDITMRQTGGQTLYDVETGTLVGPPSPYRIMILKNKELEIRTEHVTQINVPLPGNLSFEEYSLNAFYTMLDRFFATNSMGVPSRLSSIAIPLAKNAMMAHFNGDENISPLELARINEFSAASPDSTKRAVDLLMNLWTDLNTKDNKWHIKLTDP